MAMIKLIVLFFNIFYVKPVFAGIESTAVLLDCDNDTSRSDVKKQYPPYHTIENCTRKIRLTINVTNVGKTPPELTYVYVGHIADPDYEAKMHLLNPLVIRLRQEQVLLAYPFHYLTAVNGRASEIVLNYENRKNFTGCDDSSMINPTCGMKHERGKAVKFSEGFCCYCPEIPVNEKQPRGGQDCSLDVGDPTDEAKQSYKASAHCLHFSDIWYSVSSLNKPFILHETFLQIYIEKHFKDGSSAWYALTHDEDFALTPQTPYQYDDNKTIVISYVTDNPKEAAVTLPLSDRRLLTPQPMPSFEFSKLPKEVLNGATDYILLPKDFIDPVGDVCDVAGVSYKGFALQQDRCSVPKDTCLKNQPLDFWDMDNEKRAAGAKGGYLLENFGIPYKDPIIVEPKTKEHYLALEYHEQHHTVVYVEVNADEIYFFTVGKYAQISKITSSTIDENINIFVSVLNAGLMPAKFTVQAVKCAYGVPDSNKEFITIPPQMTEEVLLITKQGSTSLDEKFACTVQVGSESYEIVAKREVIINPRARCICNFFCECDCMSESLECELMSEKDFQTAGFRGSLPILTAKPPHHIWFVEHPYVAMLALFLFMLIVGLIKAIFGLLGCTVIGNFGMDKVLYRPGKIKRYIQPELRAIDPVYDDNGYPVHPDTRKRVAVIGEELRAFYNLAFLFFWPCLMCKKCFRKSVELKRKLENKNDLASENADIDDESNVTGKKKEPWSLKSLNPFKRKKGKVYEPLSEQHTDDDYSPATEEEQYYVKPVGTPDSSYQHKPLSRANDSNVEKIPSSSGPVGQPLTKQQQQWQKGQQKVTTIPKK